jgi:hypothetical protein
MANLKELPASGIGSELLLRREGRPARNRLEFDPQSGELRLSPQSAAPVAQTATFVDQIASDGFA